MIKYIYRCNIKFRNDNIYDVYEGLFGGGVVAFDYNNDGYEDLYITGKD